MLWIAPFVSLLASKPTSRTGSDMDNKSNIADETESTMLLLWGGMVAARPGIACVDSSRWFAPPRG